MSRACGLSAIWTNKVLSAVSISRIKTMMTLISILMETYTRVDWHVSDPCPCINGVEDASMSQYNHRHHLPYRLQLISSTVVTACQSTASDSSPFSTIRCKSHYWLDYRINFSRITVAIGHGTDDYTERLRQYINLEIVNHEEAVTSLKKIEQKYGLCP